MTPPTYRDLGTLAACDPHVLHALALELERQGGYIAMDIAAEIRIHLVDRPMKGIHQC